MTYFLSVGVCKR